MTAGSSSAEVLRSPMEAQEIRIRQAIDSDAGGIARVHIDRLAGYLLRHRTRRALGGAGLRRTGGTLASHPLPTGDRTPSSPRLRTAGSSGSPAADRSGSGDARLPRRAVRDLHRRVPPAPGDWAGGWLPRSAGGSSPGVGSPCCSGSSRRIRPGASTRRWAVRRSDRRRSP